MNTDTITQQVRSFIADNYLLRHAEQLKNTDSFLDDGILDSTGILQLITFLGERFGVTVEDEEVTTENLDSIDKVTAYLSRKLNGVSKGQIPGVQEGLGGSL
jgi:acyl carrier protein